MIVEKDGWNDTQMVKNTAFIWRNEQRVLPIVWTSLLCPRYCQFQQFKSDNDYKEEGVVFATLDLGYIEPCYFPWSDIYRLMIQQYPTICKGIKTSEKAHLCIALSDSFLFLMIDCFSFTTQLISVKSSFFLSVKIQQ